MMLVPAASGDGGNVVAAHEHFTDEQVAEAIDCYFTSNASKVTHLPKTLVEPLAAPCTSLLVRKDRIGQFLVSRQLGDDCIHFVVGEDTPGSSLFGWCSIFL